MSTGETLTEEVELQLAKNVVDGSDRISLSVLGKMYHSVVWRRSEFRVCVGSYICPISHV